MTIGIFALKGELNGKILLVCFYTEKGVPQSNDAAYVLRGSGNPSEQKTQNDKY